MSERSIDARNREEVREAKANEELADAIERAWRSRFGKPTVTAEGYLLQIRRGR